MNVENQKLADIRLTLVGCGRMGTALLKGWLRTGLRPQNVSVLDPHPSDWLQAQAADGVQINPTSVQVADVIVLATKPQYVADAVASIGADAATDKVLLSIAAGVTISQLESMIDGPVSVVRAMPNTPAEVGQGMTGLVANHINTSASISMARLLMQAVGKVIVLSDEDQMHAVTAVSGSGPAYVFAMAEALEDSGIALGLPQQTARALAVQTIMGAGALMTTSDVPASALREAVTSPGGTTAAGLNELTAKGAGLKELIQQTTNAAAAQSRALANNTPALTRRTTP